MDVSSVCGIKMKQADATLSQCPDRGKYSLNEHFSSGTDFLFE